MPRTKALTLIEILLVIALLGVLSVVVFQYFIQDYGSPRSPVSRALNDMRTLALAMETYRIDNNSYPASERDSPLGATGASTKMDLRLLTTPIAYIFRAPDDVFRVRAREHDVSFPIYSVHYTTATATAPSFAAYPRTGWMTWSIGPDHLTNTGGYTSLSKVLANEGSPNPSIGVDRAGKTIGAAGYAGMRYDPTNGAASLGDIYRIEGEARTRPN